MSIKNYIFKISAAVVIILFPLISSAQDRIVSKISGRQLATSNEPHDYSFIFTGHLYGAPSPSRYPAASFMANTDMIKSIGADFFVMLGDVIQHESYPKYGEQEISIFKKMVANKLKIPIFNAPGNHDLGRRDLYVEHFGQTYLSFEKSSELFIVLDSELDGCQISGRQQEFVLELIKKANLDIDIKNIFIFIHQPLWAVTNKPLNVIDPWVNGGPHPKECSSFENYILPELFELSNNKNVYLISGDLGCKNYSLGKYPIEAFSLFYHKDPKRKLTYIACGLCENDKDSIVKVDITKDGDVNFEPISLRGDELKEIEYYGIDFWSKEFESKAFDRSKESKKKFGLIRKIISKFKNLLSSKQFFAGIVFSFLLMFIFVTVKKKFYRRNK